MLRIKLRVIAWIEGDSVRYVYISYCKVASSFLQSTGVSQNSALGPRGRARVK